MTKITLKDEVAMQLREDNWNDVVAWISETCYVMSVKSSAWHGLALRSKHYSPEKAAVFLENWAIKNKKDFFEVYTDENFRKLYNVSEDSE